MGGYEISNLLRDEECTKEGDDPLHQRVDVAADQVFTSLQVFECPEILK
jgi:hypothetical protein